MRTCAATAASLALLAGSSAGAASPSPRQEVGPNALAAPATATYENGAIADTALRYVGKPGWTACADAGRSGLTGGPTAVQPQFDSSGKLVKEGDGQCRAFLNCIVWMASGHTQWLGGGANYFSSLLNPNGGPRGIEIKSVANLVRGDIVQQGANAAAPNLHTYVIVAAAPRKSDTSTTRTFTVVDSNHDYKETVLSYARAITLATKERAFRMGSVQTVSNPEPPHRGLFLGRHLLGLRFGLSASAVTTQWGKPVSARTRPYALTLIYPAIRLVFSSFDQHPTTASTTLLQGVHVTSSTFRTPRGIRVRASLSLVRAAYPGGRYDKSKATFWFEYHKEGPGGEGAIIRNGHVTELFAVQSL